MKDTAVLNLDYDDPVPPDLAERARRQGRRMRRVRRAGVALAVTGALGAGAVIAGQLRFGAQDDIRGPILAASRPSPSNTPSNTSVATRNLPSSIGAGPSAQHFAAPGFVAGETAPGDRSPSGFDPGAVRLLTASTNGTQTVMLTTKNAMMCVGEIEQGQTSAHVSLCQPLSGLPAEGFWGGGLWAPTPPKGSADTPIIAFGLVRGKVSRIVVNTPRGPVEASLAPASDPGLGTLYWAQTKVPALAGSEVAQIRLIAYRDQEAVFSCTRSPCTGQM